MLVSEFRDDRGGVENDKDCTETEIILARDAPVSPLSVA
jgi:hypothetical protein